MLPRSKALSCLYSVWLRVRKPSAVQTILTSTSASQIRDKYLVILCAERDFDAVKREAERVSIASGVQFSMAGNVWDPNRGLILPDIL